MAVPQVELGRVEKRVLRWWLNSAGSMEQFMLFAGGDTRNLALLNSERVREWIAYFAKRGLCLNLSASAEEVKMRMTALLRSGTASDGVRLDAADKLARLDGMYADKGGGGVQVQINLVGGLGN